MGDISDSYGGNAFEPNQHEKTEDFKPLPPGEYHMFIEKAEVKETKKGDGSYLKLQLSVIGEEYEGRKVFDNINLSNPNSKCVEIGIKQLAALGQALGLAAITDSQELIEKIIIVKLKVKAGDGDREAENEVRTYKPANPDQQEEECSEETIEESGQKEPTGQEEKKEAKKTPIKAATTSSTKTKPPWER